MNIFEKEIKRAADSARDETPEYLWGRLERKIDRKQQKKQISFYRSLAIASSLIAIVSIVSLLYYNSNAWNPELLAYTADENLHLEEISVEADDFYNTRRVEQLVQLREASKSMGKILEY